MAVKKSAESSPLTFDLKADLIAVLDKYQSRLGGVSKSEIIRHAISGFDYKTFQPVVESHRQISVRPQHQQDDILSRRRYIPLFQNAKSQFLVKQSIFQHKDFQ